MDVPIHIRIKSKLKKWFVQKWLMTLMMLVGYWCCIWIVLTLFGYMLSIKTFLASVGIYFLYQELMGDVHKYALLRGGSKK